MSAATAALEDVYTVAEVAEMERVKPARISQACKEGRFPGAYRTGRVRGQWRIPASSIVAYREAMAAHSAESRPGPTAQVPDLALVGSIAPYGPRARGWKQRAQMQT